MNIMIFDGIFQYDAIKVFVTELGQELRNLEHHVEYINVARCGAEVIKEKIIQNKIELILTFNGVTSISTIRTRSIKCNGRSYFARSSILSYYTYT